jgi:NAD dependent epimerase/dehydratase
MGEAVLVTGAGGFIASHLVERLAAQGYRVRAFVHYNSASHWTNLDRLPPSCLDRVETVAGDLVDASSVEDAVRGCEVVFHLAALVGIPYSYVAPRSYVTTNVLGTANVLEACRRAGGVRLVHTSTSEVYGSARRVPIDEDHPLTAQSPYAASKIAADKLVESYAASFALPACIVRPFNTYGPRQSARAVIPTIVTQALSGDVLRLGSTDPVRDLTYVTDTADGFIAAARAGLQGGEVVNLGCGAGVSIQQIVDEVGQLLGKPLRVETDRSRVRPPQSEVVRLISDNRKAAAIMGWRPTVALCDGLEATIRDIDAHLDDYKVGRYAI